MERGGGRYICVRQISIVFSRTNVTARSGTLRGVVIPEKEVHVTHCRSHAIVIHDEIDLIGGKIRVKRGGGHAGHNGLRSIHARIGINYARIRLGVGHPGDKARVAGHVLKDFAKSERDWVERLVCGVAEHFPLLLSDDNSAFMSKVASVVNPPRQKQHRPQSLEQNAHQQGKKED